MGKTSFKSEILSQVKRSEEGKTHFWLWGGRPRVQTTLGGASATPRAVAGGWQGHGTHRQREETPGSSPLLLGRQSLALPRETRNKERCPSQETREPLSRQGHPLPEAAHLAPPGALRTSFLTSLLLTLTLLPYSWDQGGPRLPRRERVFPRHPHSKAHRENRAPCLCGATETGPNSSPVLKWPSPALPKLKHSKIYLPDPQRFLIANSRSLSFLSEATNTQLLFP